MSTVGFLLCCLVSSVFGGVIFSLPAFLAGKKAEASYWRSQSRLPIAGQELMVSGFDEPLFVVGEGIAGDRGDHRHYHDKVVVVIRKSHLKADHTWDEKNEFTIPLDRFLARS